MIREISKVEPRSHTVTAVNRNNFTVIDARKSPTPRSCLVSSRKAHSCLSKIS
jgi:hypothetical protein